MKVFILIFLLSYAISLYTSNSIVKRQLYNLTLYGSVQYNGTYASLTVLDLSGFEEENIYISYYVKASSFKAKEIKYAFSDNYPDEYFECTGIMESTRSSSTKKGKKNNKKTIAITLYFEFENKKTRYLILENPLYQQHTLEVTHYKTNPMVWVIIGIIIFVVVFLGFLGIIFYVVYTNEKNKKSTDNKKETPSPLYPPNQTYDSTQANTIEMQQQPPYAPQPIPPESTYSNDTGYSSGMGQQGYYSGMGVQPS